MKIDLKLIAPEKWFSNLRLPLTIAGPCSAETEDQVLGCARALSAIPEVSVFRAGVWKPRTRPNSFEGVGSRALDWLVKAKKKYGLLNAVEVAKARHVEEALKAGIDILWIGARTTVNPFSVQEIADALKGSALPVLVKNPVNPDLGLWIGALERLNDAGIHKLAAIHRGFSTHEESIYRNPPQWKIPIELHRLIPDLPIICDPSHIAGSRELIYPVAQEALDLRMSGLMIECHHNPDKAWSDARQQIHPDTLRSLIQKLIIRNPYSEDQNFENEIKKLRQQIDKKDRQLIETLAERMQIARKIGRAKKDNKVTILQVERWQEILDLRNQQAESLGLDGQIVREIFKLIHQHSIDMQTQIMNHDESLVSSAK